MVYSIASSSNLTQAATLDTALLEVKQQIEKALRQYKNPPIPTK